MNFDPDLNKKPSEIIQSKDNPLIKKIRGIGADAKAFKNTRVLWLEGEHLCSAAFDKGVHIEHLVCSQTSYRELLASYPLWFEKTDRVSIVHDSLLKLISNLPSPACVGFLVSAPDQQPLNPYLPSLVLDRVQDAGNVGSILRSAAAFGYQQIISLQGTAGLWTSKVLRAGMGAHFSLKLIESAALEEVLSMEVPLLCTSSHNGEYLHELQLKRQIPWPCAWVFGHEGQGVRQELVNAAAMRVKIAQPAGEESLNVGAATAICLYAGISQGA